MAKKQKQSIDYYKEIDDALKSYEQYKPCHFRDLDWIANRIDWCWKFRHISESAMTEFVDRFCAILNEED